MVDAYPIDPCDSAAVYVRIPLFHGILTDTDDGSQKRNVIGAIHAAVVFPVGICACWEFSSLQRTHSVADLSWIFPVDFTIVSVAEVKSSANL